MYRLSANQRYIHIRTATINPLKRKRVTLATGSIDYLIYFRILINYPMYDLV